MLLMSPGTVPPPMNPMAPHAYQPSRAPYGPPPTGPPPTMKPTPPPTGPPMANATPPPPKADGKFLLVSFNLVTFDIWAWQPYDNDCHIQMSLYSLFYKLINILDCLIYFEWS